MDAAVVLTDGKLKCVYHYNQIVLYATARSLLKHENEHIQFSLSGKLNVKTSVNSQYLPASWLLKQFV